jgi:hypothetical protein
VAAPVVDLDQTAALLGGVRHDVSGSSCIVIDRTWEAHDWHGRRTMEGYAIEAAAPIALFDPRLAAVADWSSRIVFFDIETTGLSGGAGTLPLLAGCGWFERGRFTVRQFFLSGPSGELELPEQQMHTTSYWMTIPAEIMAALPYGPADRRDGVVGLAFAMRNVAPLLLMCDSHDLGLSLDGITLDGASRVGGSSKGASPEPSAEPTVFIYDNYPGGIGFSEPLFAMHDTLVARTRELIDECPCESGCPSCVGPEGATGPLAKTVASRLLAGLTLRNAIPSHDGSIADFEAESHA